MADAQDTLEVVPLGGLGEFGMNMMAVSWGETTLVIDAGAMFPGPELPGGPQPSSSYMNPLCFRPDSRYNKALGTGATPGPVFLYLWSLNHAVNRVDVW